MQDCFACRLMRSFGITGLGALLGTGAGVLAGLPRAQVAYCAMAGGLLLFFIVQKTLSGRRRRARAGGGYSKANR